MHLSSLDFFTSSLYKVTTEFYRLPYCVCYDCPVFFENGLCAIREISSFVSWCFKPSQPQRTILGLRENSIKRYIVEKTNKAEIRPEEQSEKAESCWKNLLNEIQLKGS